MTIGGDTRISGTTARGGEAIAEASAAAETAAAAETRASMRDRTASGGDGNTALTYAELSASGFPENTLDTDLFLGGTRGTLAKLSVADLGRSET
jgi:hypothetical protein